MGTPWILCRNPLKALQSQLNESCAGIKLQNQEKKRAIASNKVPCHIFLPVVPAARVIGKRGANIKEIRDKSGAMVKILQKELPQEMQRREDRVAAITGEPAAVREAISGVLERVFDRSGLPDTADASVRDRGYIVEVLVPEKCGSHLIGQKGERVKTLCQETKCDMRVGQDAVCGLEQKKVRISANNIQEASAAVWRRDTAELQPIHAQYKQDFKHLKLPFFETQEVAADRCA
ncbi:PEP [Symbiodinium natans]|uniref:PEP protein n=1 Tax=Symbiodinium natans TaxID=878477 RepID=A0A812QJX7_9DINO|nr:PEP [Symbiodinium natans]